MEYQLSVFLISRPFTRALDYRLSAASPPQPGCRVSVPLGTVSANLGIIVRVQEAPSAAQSLKLKEAIVLDEKPVFAKDIYELCLFAADYYHYPLGQCFFTALPSLLREGRPAQFKPEPALRLCPGAPAAPSFKSEDLARLFELLRQSPAPLLKQELKDRGFSATQLRTLVKRQLAEEVEIQDTNEPCWQERCKAPLKNSGLELNAEQSQAVSEVCAALGSFKTFLLDGVTGSGKTEVYLQIIAAVLQRGQSALVLVPEIALTPQTVERFYQRFNAPVLLLHSALSDQSRLNVFLTMQSGRAAILIGTRSALFTPLHALGLIVIDEEHDSSFKQGDGLRYHARTLALKRAELNACPLVLGSATPSLESVWQAQNGHYQLLRLTQRAGNAVMPECTLVDLRKEPLSLGLHTGIGRTLEDAIGEETARGNQVLLFLNRRGYAHQLVCHNCGTIFTCPHCDSALTVHRQEGKLRCHICDTSLKLPERCPHCGGENLLENGFGTEQAEAFLRLRYPDLGIERIDRDSVKNKDNLEQKLQRIRNGESSILIGTQMLAKGHDFPNVTLVGILDIDGGLFSDDFRAPEYTAQLLTQVAGRAGRAAKRGRVIIQSHHPDNLLIHQVIDPSLPYLSLAYDLLQARLHLHLPPASCQAFLLSNSLNREKAHLYLLQLLQTLTARLPQFRELSISPVMSDKIEKRHNRYHFHIQVLSPDQGQLHAFLQAALQAASLQKGFAEVRFAIDVDPLTLY